jgi:hypothetical protein
LVAEAEENSKFKNAAVLMMGIPQLRVSNEGVYGLALYQIETGVETVEAITYGNKFRAKESA